MKIYLLLLISVISLNTQAGSMTIEDSLNVISSGDFVFKYNVTADTLANVHPQEGRSVNTINFDKFDKSLGELTSASLIIKNDWLTWNRIQVDDENFLTGRPIGYSSTKAQVKGSYIQTGGLTFNSHTLTDFELFNTGTVGCTATIEGYHLGDDCSLTSYDSAASPSLTVEYDLLALLDSYSTSGSSFFSIGIMTSVFQTMIGCTAVNGLGYPEYIDSHNQTCDLRTQLRAATDITVKYQYDTVSAVPVPAAAFMFAPALMGFLGLRRRSKQA